MTPIEYIVRYITTIVFLLQAQSVYPSGYEEMYKKWVKENYPDYVDIDVPEDTREAAERWKHEHADDYELMITRKLSDGKLLREYTIRFGSNIYTNKVEIVDNEEVIKTLVTNCWVSFDTPGDPLEFMVLYPCMSYWCAKNIRIFKLPELVELEPVYPPEGTKILKTFWKGDNLILVYGSGTLVSNPSGRAERKYMEVNARNLRELNQR